MTSSLRACLAAESWKRLFPNQKQGGDRKSGKNKPTVHGFEDYREFARVSFKSPIGQAEQALAILNYSPDLNSGQWACIAAEADDLLAAIAEESAKNVGGRPSKDQLAVQAAELFNEEKPRQKIAEVSKPDDQKTATKAAELFNTNRTSMSSMMLSSVIDDAPKTEQPIRNQSGNLFNAFWRVLAHFGQGGENERKSPQSLLPQGIQAVFR